MGIPCAFAGSCASAWSGKREPTVSGRESEAWTVAGSLQALWQWGKSKENVRKSEELGYSRRHIGIFQTHSCCTFKVLLGQTCIHVTWNSVASQQQQQLRTTFQSLRNSPARPLPPFHHPDEVTSVTAPSCLHISQQTQQHSPQAPLSPHVSSLAA